jgi:hypothetical protein
MLSQKQLDKAEAQSLSPMREQQSIQKPKKT